MDAAISFPVYSKTALAPRLPKAQARFKPGTNLADHFKIMEQVQNDASPQRTVIEISTDTFAAAFYERQRYEVDAGRDEEPILYTPIYDEVSDPTLPRMVPVNRLGPAGVVFEEITEGGEVKFATVGESSYSVPIKHYGVGLEYTKDLVIFNELWNLSIVERKAGRAYNALLNHLHLYPILNYVYGADNLTPANELGASFPEVYLRTLEDAITASTEDVTNPRPGPYILLVSTGNQFTVERALTGVNQQGVQVQSSALTALSGIIAYNGWTGTRGHKTTSYPGVPAGTAFLISVANRSEDFQSYEKQTITRTDGNEDVSRFILEQSVWDFYRGVYANPTRSVEKITWPTTFSATP